MPRTIQAESYLKLIERAEAHYSRQGFVKWSDLASEIGVSRQRVHQMMRIAVKSHYISKADLDRYRSPASRHKQAQENEELRSELKRCRVQFTLTQENHKWLTALRAEAPPHTTIGDLINTVLTTCRKTPNE